MSVKIVKDYFKKNNIDKEILEFPVSSATVELAAQAVGVEPARIAKTLGELEQYACAKEWIDVCKPMS